jgi:hypothetical protein
MKERKITIQLFIAVFAIGDTHQASNYCWQTGGRHRRSLKSGRRFDPENRAMARYPRQVENCGRRALLWSDVDTGWRERKERRSASGRIHYALSVRIAGEWHVNGAG